MVYQRMFAIITPALISGAFAERMKFSAYCLFTLAWATLVYDPLAHWVWGPRRLARPSAARSTSPAARSCTSSSGVSALVVRARARQAASAIRRTRHPPHNLTMTVLGAGLLWFGWFGFNAGSALAADGLAALALRQHAPRRGRGRAGLGRSSRRSRIGKVDDARRRLGPGRRPGRDHAGGRLRLADGGDRHRRSPPAWSATAACCSRASFGYDDALDAFGVHGVGGALGALLTGVFATKALNPGGADGLLAAAPASSPRRSSASSPPRRSRRCHRRHPLVVKATIGLRVTADEEREGLDTALHGETGYSLGTAVGMHGSSASHEDSVAHRAAEVANA